MEKKAQTIIKLDGYTLTGDKAKAHQASLIRSFRNPKGSIMVKAIDSNTVRVLTHNNEFILTRHESIENLYIGSIKGIKVHFTKAKIVGKLIYWA